MQVKSIAAILSTFIKLLFVIKIFVLSIFEWPFSTDYTVHVFLFQYRFIVLMKHNADADQLASSEAS